MTGCVCSYAYEDCDSADFWREGRVAKTRKAHRCYECADMIPTGSRCCSVFAVFEGRAETWYRCPTCAILAELIAELNKACPLWGGLRDSAEYACIDWHDWREKAKSV